MTCRRVVNSSSASPRSRVLLLICPSATGWYAFSRPKTPAPRRCEKWRACSVPGEIGSRHPLPVACRAWRPGALENGAISPYDLRPPTTYPEEGRKPRTLKGAKPTDLPVEQPTKLGLVIHLKTREGARPDDPTVAPGTGRRGHSGGPRPVCTQVVPNSGAFLIIPAHSSARGRRGSVVQDQILLYTYAKWVAGLKILVRIPAHS
jgi:hypothetical protein